MTTDGQTSKKGEAKRKAFNRTLSLLRTSTRNMTETCYRSIKVNISMIYLSQCFLSVYGTSRRKSSS